MMIVGQRITEEQVQAFHDVMGMIESAGLHALIFNDKGEAAGAYGMAFKHGCVTGVNVGNKPVPFADKGLFAEPPAELPVSMSYLGQPASTWVIRVNTAGEHA